MSNPSKAANRAANQLYPLLLRKKGPFGFVACNGNDDAVEQLGGPLDYV